MRTYFTLTTTVDNAIDNVTLHGYAIYEPTDVLRLITAHAKYPFSLTFAKPADEDQELICLKQFLRALDEMVLHKEVVKWVPGEKKVLAELVTQYHEVSEDDEYIYLDLSDGREFKYLKRDRTAMLAENRRVGEVMSFLLKAGVEFEYDGSRAALKIEKIYYNQFFTSFVRFYDGGVFSKIKLTVKGHEYIEVIETVEVEPIN
jgi:hypothetical protein